MQTKVFTKRKAEGDLTHREESSDGGARDWRAAASHPGRPAATRSWTKHETVFTTALKGISDCWPPEL